MVYLKSVNFILLIFIFSQSVSDNKFKFDLNVKLKDSCECGVSYPSPLRVVGGKETQENSYPWIAALISNSFFNYSRFYCAGSLINDRYVLTTAHCIEGEKPEENSVLLNPSRLNLAYITKSDGLFAEVESLIVHAEFERRAQSDYNDIGLVKLKNLAPIRVPPVCLPYANDNDYSGLAAIVAGWGNTRVRGSKSQVLLEAEVQVMTHEKCSNLERLKGMVLESMLCAYGDGKDACQSDSGGPLIYKQSSKKTEKFYIEEIGIVSWGIGCATPGLPGVYTRISSYLEWIKSNTLDALYCKRPVLN